jgi:hypothetical protein
MSRFPNFRTEVHLRYFFSIPHGLTSSTSHCSCVKNTISNESRRKTPPGYLGTSYVPPILRLRHLARRIVRGRSHKAYISLLKSIKGIKRSLLDRSNTLAVLFILRRSSRSIRSCLAVPREERVVNPAGNSYKMI